MVASAAFPGAGQLLERRARGAAYLAVEAFAWVRYSGDRRTGVAQRDRYRRLADVVARAAFGGPLPLGSFAYYESMERYVESGPYGADAGGVFDPPTDTSTFNGAAWLLARQTYWTNPSIPPDPGTRAYQAAVEFYRARAVRPEYQWSWRHAPLQHEEFRRTIRASNNAFRDALRDLGLVIANHAFSTVDAFVTVRLGRGAPGIGDDGIAVTGRLPLPARLLPW